MSNKEVVDYIKKSFELKNQGFYKPAIEMLYKALSIDSDNVEILAQLAHLYKLLGNSERAIHYIEKVLEIDKNHLQCLILEEDIYLEQGFLQLAKNVVEKIYEIQPTSKNLAKKINLLNKLQEFDAIREIQEDESKFDDEVLYETAQAYCENYDKAKAIELLEKGYKKNNKNIQIINFLAKLYYENKEFEKSLKLFKEAQEINPDAVVMNYLGLFAMNDKHLSKAIDYFMAAQKMDETNAEYAYNLGSAYFLNGWLDEASKYFNKAICLDSENLDYHYSLAYLYYQKKDWEKALYELNFIKTVEQHHEPSNVLEALITAKKGDLLTARKQLEIIIKSFVDDFAYWALAQVYKELSLYDLAKDSIELAIKLNPDSLDYLGELVEVQLELKNYEEALETAEQILSLNEKYVYAYVAIAKINLAKKDFEAVFEAAQNIIELDSNSPEGYYYNALALFAQGDKDFAIESLKKAISLDLTNAMLYVKMSEFYQDLGDLRTALEWAKEAVGIDERNYKYKWLCANLAAAMHNQDEAIKYYSQSYRIAGQDEDLKCDYAKYLTSIGKEKQAQKLLK